MELPIFNQTLLEKTINSYEQEILMLSTASGVLAGFRSFVFVIRWICIFAPSSVHKLDGATDDDSFPARGGNVKLSHAFSVSLIF